MRSSKLWLTASRSGQGVIHEVFGTTSVEWTHDGITYLITAQPRPWDPSAVVDAWKTVQYATPRHS